MTFKTFFREMLSLPYGSVSSYEKASLNLGQNYSVQKPTASSSWLRLYLLPKYMRKLLT